MKPMYESLENLKNISLQLSSQCQSIWFYIIFRSYTSDSRYSMETLDSEHPIIGKYTGIEMCVSW